MTLTRTLSALLAPVMALIIAPSALAQEGEATPHYPLEHPHHEEWSFAGPFGNWEVPQLQRGLQVYIEVCAACHSLKYVAFRNLEALGYSEEEVSAFAAGYDITDGPNSEGEMFERPGRPSDHFPPPFPNEEAAAFANNGAPPPDLSLITKARAPERGFPWFIFDVFTLYAENGADYLYSLLTGYEEAPAGVEIPETAHYNPFFGGGVALAMPAPLSDGVVTYADGAPETVDQYARDVTAFLMWAAEPHMVERKRLGFIVMLFLTVFAGLVYLVKKKVWAEYKQREQAA
jgi:ubiquinol-cytochrome c reductase cytochrome c1 subunit